ncbi:MAG: hypothetical protein A2521_11135 [Deltaproteobacteria bacterium RIFOXYD12_FULL_57_12]|nr:MAG: hypothetical protein A2521_11135 [Deltaproteobacteria bacterium RIFOXYD12_FULL_57_12]
MTDLDKLRVLLPHWIEHNRGHLAEFRKWATMAGSSATPQAAMLLEQAAARLAEADVALAQALVQLGGAVPDSPHPHHHDHDDHHHGS